MTESARGAHCSSHGFDAFEINQAGPMSVALQRGANDDRIGIGKQPGRALWSCTTASQYGKCAGRANRIEFGFVNCSAGFRASDNHSVGKKELCGASACSNVNGQLRILPTSPGQWACLLDGGLSKF